MIDLQTQDIPVFMCTVRSVTECTYGNSDSKVHVYMCLYINIEVKVHMTNTISLIQHVFLVAWLVYSVHANILLYQGGGGMGGWDHHGVSQHTDD